LRDLRAVWRPVSVLAIGLVLAESVHTSGVTAVGELPSRATLRAANSSASSVKATNLVVHQGVKSVGG
jgi:hypothetical protein